MSFNFLHSVEKRIFPGMDKAFDLNRSSMDIYGVPFGTPGTFPYDLAKSAKSVDERAREGFDGLRNHLYGDDTDTDTDTDLASGAGAGSGYYGSSPVTYSDWSPAAKLFGMNSETAYQEHLANTAHQREVADLKAAGLNPVLGISSSGAPVFSGSAYGGYGYASTGKKVSLKSVADVLGSIAGMIVLAKSKNKYAGSWTASMTSKAFSQAGKLLDDFLE